MSQELVKRNESVEAVLQRLETIQELTKRAMQKDVDYGVIPGTQKPTLLMPGAEKLCVLFRLSPSFKTTKTFDQSGHLTVESTCAIADHDGVFLGEASAICSTRESKYAYRRGQRKCPECGAAQILRSKFPPRDEPEAEPGWYCWQKKGGCGYNFVADDPRITSQSEGEVPNERLADSYNTVLRIAEKRAYVACVRKVTGSSGFFDEEIPEQTEETKPEPKQEQPKPEPAKQEKPTLSPEALKFVNAWSQKLASDRPNAATLNDWIASEADQTPEEAKPGIRNMIAAYARGERFRFDNETRRYFEAGQPTPAESSPPW